MACSKKDFEAIAAAFQVAHEDMRDIGDASGEQGVYCAARIVASRLAQTNPRFDAVRFLRACEPGANVRARG